MPRIRNDILLCTLLYAVIEFRLPKSDFNTRALRLNNQFALLILYETCIWSFYLLSSLHTPDKRRRRFVGLLITSYAELDVYQFGAILDHGP